MSENIAVEGLTLSHVTGSTIYNGTFTITSVASSVTKEDNKGIYTSPLTFTFAGGDAPGMVSGSVVSLGPQNILATAQKTKEYGILVIREGDSLLMLCQGISDSTGNPVPISGDVEISDAGQEKVKAG